MIKMLIHCVKCKQELHVVSNCEHSTGYNVEYGCERCGFQVELYITLEIHPDDLTR